MQCRRIGRSLSRSTADQLEQAGQRELLRAFARAAREVPAYRDLLARHGVSPAAIRTIDDFRRLVPVVDKQAVFGRGDLTSLLAGGRLGESSVFWTSSGHSGVYSFGVDNAAQQERAAIAAEFLLDRTFGVLDRRTLLVNCLPMGVKIPVRAMSLAETSVRTDAALAIIRSLGGQFEQIILMAESLVLKKLIEDGPAAGVDWHKLTVHAVTGAEFIAENYRSYLAHLMGIDFDRPERGVIGVNMGMSELALSVFSESVETIRIRRLAQGDSALRQALFGRTDIVPELMQYFPMRTYVETLEEGEGEAQRLADGANPSGQLVVSVLDPHARLPLIRYRTGDQVTTMPYARLEALVRLFGREDLLPAWKLPLGIIWGRNPHVQTPEGPISPAHVKEALYADFDLAGRVTGVFVIQSPPGSRGGGPCRPTLLVQLKEGQAASSRLADRLAERLAHYTPAQVNLHLAVYRDFPVGMEFNYERKCRYVA